MGSDHDSLTVRQKYDVIRNLALAYWSMTYAENAPAVRQYKDRRDARQEAALGLCEAVRRFKKEKGTKLCTYARWWFRARIQNGLEKDLDERQTLVGDWPSGTSVVSEDGLAEPRVEDPPPFGEEESGNLLAKMLTHLPPGDIRKAVALKSSGFNSTEVGEMLGIHRVKVHQLVSKAQKILVERGVLQLTSSGKIKHGD